MRRLAHAGLALLFVLLAIGAVAFKGWLELTGPYLEALPPYPFCDQAEAALAEDRVAEALELAEAGACGGVLERAQARWDSFAATAGRCWDGVWTGFGEDAAGVGCAVVSDLFVFGDVRDLTLQGLRWQRGEETDPVLAALSGAGLVLTFAPAVGAGNSLLKVARRAGTMTRGLADSVTALARQRSWGALGGLLGDAGRISRKLGPAGGTRALAYADTPAELARLSRFVDSAQHPLVALRLGGKRVAGLSDDLLYRTALSRGPGGLALAVERGGGALLARKPFVAFAAKALYKHPDALAAWSLAFASTILRWATWPSTLGTAAALLLIAYVLYPYRRSRRRRRRGWFASLWSARSRGRE